MSGRYSKSPEIDAKVKELVHDGWRVFRGGAHYRVVHPEGKYTLTVPGTPGDHRTVQNWFAQYRRAEAVGFDSKLIFGRRG